MKTTVRCNTCKFGDWGYAMSNPMAKSPCHVCVGYHKWQPKPQKEGNTNDESNVKKTSD